MKIILHQVDAFADAPFTGNPAAVCLLDRALDESLMQNIAAEMNLSETSFLTNNTDGYRLRWFTPASEVDLCGHATLAAAHILWETGTLSPDNAALFDTLSGRLTARRNGALIEMDFPAEPPVIKPVPDEVYRAVGSHAVVEVGANRLDYFVVLEDEQAVRSLSPDLGIVSRLGTRGMIVTARARSDDYDFVSRYFAPQFGIPEDPVTGSTHCCLAPYWSVKLAKQRLRGWQASARGGRVEATVRGDRVILGGRAVTVARIEMTLPD